MINYYLKTAWRKLVNSKDYSFINIAGLSLSIFGSIVIFQFVKFHIGTDTYHQKFRNIYRVVMDLHLDEGIEHEKGSPFILHETLKSDFSVVENTAYLGQHKMTISIPKGDNSPDRYLEKEFAAFVNEGYFKIFDYQWMAGNGSLLTVPNTAVQDFAYRIGIGWGVFLLAGVLALLIALATISVQSVKAAIANPIKSLRTE